jgi:preprotein translocase subunit SecF
VKLQAVEFVGPQVGRELAVNGRLGARGRDRRHHALPRDPLRVEVRGGRDRREPARRDHHPGFFAFFQWEFNLTVLAAVLAVLGYSVNESVVIFDRIREAFRRFRKMNTHEVIDHAITAR